MCVGLAVLCGPPTVGLLCFFTWNGGDSVVSKNLGMDATPLSFASGGEPLTDHRPGPTALTTDILIIIMTEPRLLSLLTGASAASLWAAYRAQHRLLIHHFDEGGKYAYGYRKGEITPFLGLHSSPAVVGFFPLRLGFQYGW
jgi:hypothetical protein